MSCVSRCLMNNNNNIPGSILYIRKHAFIKVGGAACRPRLPNPSTCFDFKDSHFYTTHYLSLIHICVYIYIMKKVHIHFDLNKSMQEIMSIYLNIRT